MSDRGEYLFLKLDLAAWLRAREHQMLNDVDEMDSGRLLDTDVEELSCSVERKYRVEPIQLEEAEITADQHEAQVDVSQDWRRAIPDRDRPVCVQGTKVSFFVPFDGDKELFNWRPATEISNPPRAEIREGEIVLTYARTDQDAEAFRTSLEEDLSKIRKYVEWIAKDLEVFNGSLREKAKNRVEARRQKLLKDQGLMRDLGFPRSGE